MRLVGVTGVAVTTARVTQEVKSGMIFVPFFLREVREQLCGEAGILLAEQPRAGLRPAGKGLTMRARITDNANLLKLVDLLREEYEVIAPFYGRGRDTCFDTVTDANRHLVQVHLPNPYYPPKRYVLPHIERLLRIHLNDHPRIQPSDDTPRRAIFGIRSCDMAGIYHLDRFYLGRDFKDTYYERHRQNLFLVNVVCTDPELDIDDDCFCMCADTGPAARDHFDLQLMDLGDEFLVVAGSDKGEALFAHPMFRKGTPAHVERRRQILADVRKRFKITTSWFSATVRYITQRDGSATRPGRRSGTAVWSAAAAATSARPAPASR